MYWKFRTKVAYMVNLTHLSFKQCIGSLEQQCVSCPKDHIFSFKQCIGSLEQRIHRK